MKVHIINQEPLTVNAEQGRKLVQSIASGADMVLINGEMIKSSAIMGIRNDTSGETLTVSQWGALPAGKMAKFYDERREPLGSGYAKYKAMRSKILAN